MPVDRRALVIGGLGALVAAALAWTLGGSSDDVPRTARRAAGAAGVAVVTGPAVDVRLESLQVPREEPGGSARNPFRFEARRPAQAPAPATPGPDGQPVGRRPLAPSSPARGTGAAPPPPITLKFFGVVERNDGVKVAALSDGRSVMHGREGDIIEGRYRILSIGVESIEVSYVDGSGRQTIRLTGQ